LIVCFKYCAVRGFRLSVSTRTTYVVRPVKRVAGKLRNINSVKVKAFDRTYYDGQKKNNDPAIGRRSFILRKGKFSVRTRVVVGSETAGRWYVCIVRRTGMYCPNGRVHTTRRYSV